MMNMLWMVLFVASVGLHLGFGYPVIPTPHTYPHDASKSTLFDDWRSAGWYAAVPALALVVAAFGFIFGCTWCFRHKDCKPNEGADNQLFTANAAHLRDVRRVAAESASPPDAEFTVPINNNMSEDNNNGPISLREMQNIANNNAAAYIVSENEERNRESRESLVEFEPLPLPLDIGVSAAPAAYDPLERCADWFRGDFNQDLQRNKLQYLREIERGWFGRVVQGEIEEDGRTTTVAVKILSQNSSMEDEARFLDESKIYRDCRHENFLAYVTKCLQEEPWLLVFEFCNMNLQQYLEENRPRAAFLNESGVSLRLLCDVSSAMVYLHSMGYMYRHFWCGNILVRGEAENARAVVGHYVIRVPPLSTVAPEARRPNFTYTISSDVWSLGSVVWAVSTWGETPPSEPHTVQDLLCPYKNHLYQVMQLCWNQNPEARPSSAQVHALINHLYTTHSNANEGSQEDAYGSTDFEQRWQHLKPNSIPVTDEHVAIVHAPSTSMASHFTGSDPEFDNIPTIVQDSLSIDMDTAVSRSSSIMSDKDPLSVQIKSESLNNLHGSLEDVRNIYLTHRETPVMECHQANITLEDNKDTDNDQSDSSVDPWLRDIIAGSHDDVSYYKDVSDVIKNLDNILNSEKTSSSESSHQASPSRDNLILECKNDHSMQSSLVKSPGINDFQSALEMGFDAKLPENEPCDEDNIDRDTVGTLSHSFERHSDTTSQHTLENLTPETPIKDVDVYIRSDNQFQDTVVSEEVVEPINDNIKLPKEIKEDNVGYSISKIPKLKELCAASIPSISLINNNDSIYKNNEQVNVREDCETTCDSNLKSISITVEKKNEAKSIDDKCNTEVVLEAVKQDNANVTMQVIEQSNDKQDFTQDKPVNEILSLEDGVPNNILIIEPNISYIPTTMKKDQNSIVLSSINKFLDKKSCEHLSYRDNTPINPEHDLPVLNSNIGDLSLNSNNDLVLFPDNTEAHANLAIQVLAELKNKSDLEQDIQVNNIGTSKPSFPYNILVKESNFSHLTTMVKSLKLSSEPLPDHNKFEEIVQVDNTAINSEHDLPVINTISSDLPSNSNIDLISTSENTKAPKASELEITFRDSIESNFDLITIIRTDEFNAVMEKEQKMGDTDIAKSETENEIMPLIYTPTAIPEIVQNMMDKEYDISTPQPIANNISGDIKSLVQDTDMKILPDSIQSENGDVENLLKNHTEEIINRKNKSDGEKTLSRQISNDSTVYMDLINDTTNDIKNCLHVPIDYVTNRNLEISHNESLSFLLKNESTMYLDLPNIIRHTYDFLHSERELSNYCVNFTVNCSSTPKGSAENILESTDHGSDDYTLDNSVKQTCLLSETKVPDYGPGVTVTKLEQRYVEQNASPLESPTKSHYTDTYDENSSVVLGPFENCTLDLFKGAKSTEEVLAFSSNFSEIDLETPSPLRDGNFLNEVPDIVHDDLEFEHIQNINEIKEINPETEDSDTGDKSSTEKRVSPNTPPNSPGNFLVSCTQQKYLVDIDLNPTVSIHSESPAPMNLHEDIDLNKLAMADNENNMNIEYAGPLSVEGLLSEISSSDDVIAESYLAGNGSALENVPERLTLDEDSMQALINELELKLPLAQVASIEPEGDGETEGEGDEEGSWSGALPPPPELVVSYPPALSPIAEETRIQLAAYDNDINWNPSIRTDSSESYPEPCNLSTDEVTDLPTGAPTEHHDNSTYTLPSNKNSLNNTFTLHKDENEASTSKEITMSADSLNASPCKKIDITSSIDDRTYNKLDYQKDSNCERISQVSPFLVSPTTDTSVPENSDNVDNVTGVSTVSKTSQPTDAKISKPSETQCPSNATSIDSWCSNDTLYNVEENFDDLAMEPAVLEYESKKDDDSESSTLTHNNDEKELSHCSTYIIHDSRSEICETFSPDSITANDNYTYTKAKTEVVETTQSGVTKSEFNDSTKNTQTKDLAYWTLMSAVPSHSNCTTEVVSGFEEAWTLPQPEMVRRSSFSSEVNVSLPKQIDDLDINKINTDSPKFNSKPCMMKMESVEIICLQDNVTDSIQLEKSKTDESPVGVQSLNYHFRNIANSLTSTPCTEIEIDNDVDAIPMQLPSIIYENASDLGESPCGLGESPCGLYESPENCISDVPNIHTFLYSAELRPQDLSSNTNNEAKQNTSVLLEGDLPSENSNKDSQTISYRSPIYSDFEFSAVTRPQDADSYMRVQYISSQITENDQFRQFENSVRTKPQDLSSFVDASSLLLSSERIFSDVALSETNYCNRSARSGNVTCSPIIPLGINSPINQANEESFNNSEGHNMRIINLGEENETEQPHSIIITENTKLNNTYNSHTSSKYVTASESHSRHSPKAEKDSSKTEDESETGSPKLNGLDSVESHKGIEEHSQSNNSKDSGKALNSDELTNTMKCNGNSEQFATVNFLNEAFEELMESNVDDGDKELKVLDDEQMLTLSEIPKIPSVDSLIESDTLESPKEDISNKELVNCDQETERQITSASEDFLINEKKFCQFDCYLSLLSDIRFTGPASEIMSTSFTEESPTEPNVPETESDVKPNVVTEILKEWDSDTESHTSNSSSGEFIWKQRDGGNSGGANGRKESNGDVESCGDGSGDSGSGSGSGSEGDEVEFVPSSWDCLAAPSKSSLRSLEQVTPDSKKRVVFKRQKYHCVYEYPREVADFDADSPANYLPDFSTYSEWDTASAEDAELGYGQLYGASNPHTHPHPLDMYPLRTGFSFTTDYDEDFFISSSARPFESLGLMTTSQFFPGMHIKPALQEREIAAEINEDFPPPPSPLPATTNLAQTRTPSLDFTTPDSGVEVITPVSTIDEEFKAKKLLENDCWKPMDSGGSSSESVSPSSPGGETLGGLRHTRDKLKLDLPPSPHIPSPRHNRIFNFVLDKPKRHRQSQEDKTPPTGTTPLVMTDDTPIVTTSLPIQKENEEVPLPEPTFSTFGKCSAKVDPEQKIILDEVQDSEKKEETDANYVKVVEAVKGEGTVLDSGDEDSGIESSSKATLERNKSTPNIS